MGILKKRPCRRGGLIAAPFALSQVFQALRFRAESFFKLLESIHALSILRLPWFVK